MKSKWNMLILLGVALLACMSDSESEICDASQAADSGKACLLDFQRDLNTPHPSSFFLSGETEVCCLYREYEKCLELILLEAGCENETSVEDGKTEASRDLQATGNNCSDFDTTLCSTVEDTCDLFEFDGQEMDCRIAFNSDFPYSFLTSEDHRRACCVFKNLTICIQRALTSSSCNHELALPTIHEGRFQLDRHGIGCLLGASDPCSLDTVKPETTTSSTSLAVKTTSTLAATTVVQSSATTESVTETDDARQPRQLSGTTTDVAAVTNITGLAETSVSTVGATSDEIVTTDAALVTTKSTKDQINVTTVGPSSTPTSSGAPSVSNWLSALFAMTFVILV